jgi:hydroxymethylglutaryl-CoA reductase (NADPH)
MASWILPPGALPAGRAPEAEPGWLKNQLTNSLQSVSRRACAHPIHTIVVIALLASTTYVGLLEGSLFDAGLGSRDAAGQLDISSLLQGGRNLRLGERTSWRWQVDENATSEDDQVRIRLTHGEIPEALTIANADSTAYCSDNIYLP